MKKNIALVYDYPSLRGYSPGAVNLGDYIQSMAAMQFYPSIDGYIDREKLDQLPDDAKVIMNGWYWTSDHYQILSRAYVFPVSVCIANQSVGSVKSFRSWVAHSKFEGGCIGARDLSTAKYLQALGIASRFTSCLTTTLDYSLELVPPSKREGLVFSDFNLNDVRLLGNGFKGFRSSLRIKKKLEDLINKTVRNKKSVTRVTHVASLKTNHDQRFILARRLLDIYRQAELVVTSRIHCALPCLALRTPVILIVNHKDVLRYSGLEDLFNHVYLNDEDGYSVCLERGKVVNNGIYSSWADELKEACLNFMNIA